ncbi:hypothetical protein BpHYR1_031051, partial [Brachionus plicatilis]
QSFHEPFQIFFSSNQYIITRKILVFPLNSLIRPSKSGKPIRLQNEWATNDAKKLPVLKNKYDE